MSNSGRSMLEAFLKGRFSAFLVSIALLFLVSPLVPKTLGDFDRLFSLLVLIVLASCLKSISHSRKFFVGMIVFTVLNLGIGAFEILSDVEPAVVRSIVLVVRTLYFVVVFFSIMRYVLDSSPVTGDKICGAISAYFIMGLAWSFIYALFFHLEPESFRIPETAGWTGDASGTWGMMYFSFTTLSTLGYGDITPISPGVQSYAIMEAVCGQVFLAVIIARLIALHITHERTG